jgi:hypothetical protein
MKKPMVDGAVLFIAPHGRIEEEDFEREQTEGCKTEDFSSGPLAAMVG